MRGGHRDKLQKAEAWSKAIKSTAVMVVHRGAVVAEWGDITARTPLASVRKSLLSALIGNAQGRGEINLAQAIGALGIDDNEPSLTPEEKSATVRDLLTGRSGIYHSALYESAAMAAERPPRFSHKPGTFWYYNNWDFNALGTIYERAVRSSIFDAFEREIARPIGMQDYRARDGTYVTGAGSVHAAYPIEMSARDLARFALLYLRGGRWDGRQVIPEAWVRESTRPYSHADTGPGLRLHVVDGADRERHRAIGAVARGNVLRDRLRRPVRLCHSRPRPGHRAPGPARRGRAELREIARLLWLLLDSHNISGIGEDASIEAARLPRVGGEMLSRLLAGKTLLYGEKAAQGPRRIRLGADGAFTAVRGADAVEVDTGTWSVRDDRFCRELKKLEPRQLCLTVASDGTKVQLFDPKGLMFINARIEGD